MPSVTIFNQAAAEAAKKSGFSDWVQFIISARKP